MEWGLGGYSGAGSEAPGLVAGLSPCDLQEAEGHRLTRHRHRKRLWHRKEIQYIAFTKIQPAWEPNASCLFAQNHVHDQTWPDPIKVMLQNLSETLRYFSNTALMEAEKKKKPILLSRYLDRGDTEG
ncbi:hypothetical protein KUCAC02_008887 [Chaenocephalus aceratus]|uniref:Uncharacterized protein n=1 Tax=Chaenocephalus aceratus TaxID=36190 RepID=A0ACB9WSI4_CHAAC|nr:hypothetical protein KUCAC02_008887 [Chaenocephalus aceratus]